MKEKVKNYKEGFIKLQFDTILKIEEELDKLRPEIETNQKAYALYALLDGYLRGLCFRLKTIQVFFKDILEEELLVPEKVEVRLKEAKEMFVLSDSGDLVTVDGISFSDLVEKFKSKEG